MDPLGSVIGLLILMLVCPAILLIGMPLQGFFMLVELAMEYYD